MIEAPHAAARHCEIEEHEAVDDSQLTRVQERKEASRRVRYEVCDGHVACQDERDRTCEQAEHDQYPADELNHAVRATWAPLPSRAKLANLNISTSRAPGTAGRR